MKENMDKKCFQMNEVTIWHRGGRTAANRVSLTLTSGERVLITGEEPEELRALARVSVGLERPREGSVEIDCRKTVLPEQFPYLESVRAVEYLLLPQIIQGVPREQAWKEVRELAKESGLWDRRTDRMELLTEYEKYLFLAAAGFAVRPGLLIAGNFMHALTGQERKDMGRILEQWTVRSGTAVLAFGNSWKGNFPFQRECFLREGKLEEIGNTAKV